MNYQSKCHFTSILLIIPCFLNSCLYDQSAEKFESAWQENDSIYVKQFINSLENKSPEEVGAIAQNILSEHTNFGYGMMFFPRKEKVSFWDTIPKPKQEIIKNNIIAVWLTYVESDLFSKKDCIGMIKCRGEKITFHEVFYPKRANKFTQADLLLIRKEMNEIASHCK